ncbi:MAG: ABC transporter substrate-binding protein [Paenibacillaceae bacterium]|nr:ABC transporter substrate-binding protein [Paenibacillaceae bacterium]
MKKNTGKKIGFTVLSSALVLSLAACGGAKDDNKSGASASPAGSAAPSGAASSPAAADLKPVELIWYLPDTNVPSDVKSVEDEVNKITKAKINATVKLNVVASGDYLQKMNTVVASGEKVDILWTSNWLFDYVQNQSKGAFLALDDLINKYAPAVKTSMPQFVWDATKIGGKIYGVPNYQTVTNKEGFIIYKEYIDKYKIDTTKLKKFADIEPVLAQVKAAEKSDFVYGMYRLGQFGNLARTYNMEPVVPNIAYINLSNPDKIVSLFDTPEYESYLNTVRDWYKKGYINQDAATLKAMTDLQKAGKTPFSFHNALKPGGEAEAKVQMGGRDVVYVPTSETYAGTNTIITTMQAINAKSANPERAMMLINLVNTDADLYNLLKFGIEGKHYTKNADGTAKLTKDSGYAMWDWAIGNVFNGLVLEGKDPKVAEATKKENEGAKPSPIMGFKFQTGPVAAEIANITALIDEYGPGLNTGTVDAKDKLAEYKDKLKKAGIDKVVAEVQKQLDEWKKTK